MEDLSTRLPVPVSECVLEKKSVSEKNCPFMGPCLASLLCKGGLRVGLLGLGREVIPEPRALICLREDAARGKEVGKRQFEQTDLFTHSSQMEGAENPALGEEAVPHAGTVDWASAFIRSQAQHKRV